MIAQGASMQTIVRLLCLASVTNGGIKAKSLDSVKRELLQVISLGFSRAYCEAHDPSYRLTGIITFLCFSRWPHPLWLFYYPIPFQFPLLLLSRETNTPSQPYANRSDFLLMITLKRWRKLKMTSVIHTLDTHLLVSGWYNVLPRRVESSVILQRRAVQTTEMPRAKGLAPENSTRIRSWAGKALRTC